MNRVTKKLADNASDLWDGDLLLFRGSGFVAKVIQHFTNSEYSHAAMVTWANGVPMCAEVREWHGGRLVTLESQVKRYPSQIDVYKADAQNLYNGIHRHKAARFMERLAGCDYGYWSVVKAALSRLPLLRLVIANTTAGKALRQIEIKRAALRQSPPFCSMAVDMAWCLGAGIDVVPGVESEVTEPQHLRQSMFFKYEMTLVP